MAMVRYPLPITTAMLAKANVANEAKPRYDANWTSDWHGAPVRQRRGSGRGHPGHRQLLLGAR